VLIPKLELGNQRISYLNAVTLERGNDKEKLRVLRAFVVN